MTGAFAQYTSKTEADIEDMFDPQFYLDLVNEEYKKELVTKIELKDIGKHPRILVNINEWLKANPLKAGGFNHYRPARYFTQNIGTLAAKLDKATRIRLQPNRTSPVVAEVVQLMISSLR